MTMSMMFNPLPVEKTFIHFNWVDQEKEKHGLRRCVSDSNLPIFGHVSEADVELADLAAPEDYVVEVDTRQLIFAVLKKLQCTCWITMTTSEGENAKNSKFGPGRKYDLSKDTDLGEFAAFFAEKYDTLKENRRRNPETANRNNFIIALFRHDEASQVWSDRSYECCTTITTKENGKNMTMKVRCRCNDDVTNTKSWSPGEAECLHRRLPDSGSWNKQILRKEFDDHEEIYERFLKIVLAGFGMLNDEKVAAVSVEDKGNLCSVRVYPTENLYSHRDQLKPDCPFHADNLTAEESWIYNDSAKRRAAKADVTKKGTSPSAGLNAEAGANKNFNFTSPTVLSKIDLPCAAESKKKCTSLASSAPPACWEGTGGAAWADVE